MRSQLNTGVKIIISLLVLALIFFQIEWDQLRSLQINWNFEWLGIITVCLISSLMIRSERWRLLMKDGDGPNISNVGSFKILLVGSALNIIMPAGIGDVAKSYFGYKWTGIKERMLSVSLYDKIVAISSLSVLSVYSYYFTSNLWFLFVSIITLIPLLLLQNFAVFEKHGPFKKVVVYLKRLANKVNIDEIVSNLRFSKNALVIALGLSVLGWIITYILMYLCFRICGLETLSFEFVLSMSPIITLGRLFPFTFNGIGSDEALILLLFSGGWNDPVILVAAIVYRIIVMLFPALLGVAIIASTKSLKAIAKDTV